MRQCEPDRRKSRDVSGRGGWSLLDLVLVVPLHVKIVAASVGCAGLAFGLGWLGPGIARGMALPGDPFTTAALLGAAGISAAVLVIGMIMRIALIPLRQLELAAERIEQGDMKTRATPSRLADRDMARLVRAFNGALDRQARYRRRLGELALRDLRAQESSRRRIAIELREGPGQRLASLLLRLRAAEIAGGGEVLAGLVDEVRGEITTVLDILGGYGGDRAERLLEDLGTAGAVEWKARQMARDHGLDVSVAVELVDHVLSRPARRSLFRVVQEALENVTRHAGARAASVDIRHEGAQVVVEIVDDGRGFEPDQALSHGLGLLELEEKVRALGGRLDITSALSHGTVLRAEIPVRTGERAVPNGSSAGCLP